MTKTIVLKLGGEIVQSPELDLIAADLRKLVEGFHRVAIVHGGGPQASALQKRLGLETRQVAGKRYTDPETLEVMKYVVAGQGCTGCAPVEDHRLLPAGQDEGSTRG